MNLIPPPIRGPASRLIEEANLPPTDSVLHQPRPAQPPPTRPIADPAQYEAFLRAERLTRRKRWKRSSRQTFAWVLACSALPILLVVLRELFFR